MTIIKNSKQSNYSYSLKSQIRNKISYKNIFSNYFLNIYFGTLIIIINLI